MMILSVIIPTFKRWGLLSECIEKLAPVNQSLSFQNYEVIVTSDDIPDETPAWIRNKYPWVIWCNGPQKGPAANRNSAVEHAKGQWLVFTDDDCLPQRDWLKSFTDAMHDNPGVKVFEGFTSADRERRSLAETAPVNEKGGILPSCNFSIEKELFKSLKGFDEDYVFNFEDMDLHYRLKKQNQFVYFAAKAKVIHPWRGVNIKSVKSIFRKQKSGILIFISKHPEVLKDFNSIHFVREALKNFVFITIPGAFRYRGSGAWYEMMLRMFEIEMCLQLIPDTVKYFATRLQGDFRTKTVSS